MSVIIITAFSVQGSAKMLSRQEVLFHATPILLAHHYAIFLCSWNDSLGQLTTILLLISLMAVFAFSI